jgi:hypothetical protein
MGHGLFVGLKNIEVIISIWFVMWKLYTSIIYPGKNYLVQLFFNEIIHYLKCPFSNMKKGGFELGVKSSWSKK